MKKTIAVFLSVLLLAALLQSWAMEEARSAAEGKCVMNVATFNLRMDTERDGVNAWPNRSPLRPRGEGGAPRIVQAADRPHPADHRDGSDSLCNGRLQRRTGRRADRDARRRRPLARRLPPERTAALRDGRNLQQLPPRRADEEPHRLCVGDKRHEGEEVRRPQRYAVRTLPV